MTQPTVVISGAGIAGPALAFWLTPNGYRVIVIRSEEGIRHHGQRAGDEVDAALAVPTHRGPTLVRRRGFD
jgi:2-polyprenyl-6-methoxyphenol hydroxylase-like FAD-dependent oxidoreductase